MDTATQVQILDEADHIALIRLEINPIILPPATSKIVG